MNDPAKIDEAAQPLREAFEAYLLHATSLEDQRHRMWRVEHFCEQLAKSVKRNVLREAA